MTVTHYLGGLAAGVGESHAIYYIIQPYFQDLQQVLNSRTGTALSRRNASSGTVSSRMP
jgi:hypothetical protein